MYAAGGHNSELLRLLIKAGADPAARDRVGLTPACIAFREADIAVVTALLDAAPNIVKEVPSAIMCTEHGGTAAQLTALYLQAGGDPNFTTSTGYTPLMKFSYSPANSAVTLLLSRGANPNATTREGNCALSEAVVRGNVETVRILIAAGGRPEVRYPCKRPVAVVAERRGKQTRS